MKRRTKLMLYVVAAISALAFTLGAMQHELSGSQARQGQEISIMRALNEVDLFLERVGHNRPDRTRVRWALRKIGHSSRYYSVLCSEGSRLEVDSKTGLVRAFMDRQRIEDQQKGGQDRRRRRFASGEEARPYLLSLARRISGMQSLTVRAIEFKNDGDVKDANPAGHASIIAESANGAYRITISVDILDGHPTVVGQSRRA